MKTYNKIIIFENDSQRQGLPGHVKELIDNCSVEIEPWFDFNMSFYWNKQQAFQKLSNIDKDSLVVSCPSFVGADNMFGNYFVLFLQMIEQNIKLDIAIKYHDNGGFFKYLLDFLYQEENYIKKNNNHILLKNILDFHNIYDIQDQIDNSVLITYESLMQYYVECHRKLQPTMLQIIETGEIYPAYYVNYHKNNINDYQIELRKDVYDGKSYLLSELKRV